jgi:hypothetical protein
MPYKIQNIILLLFFALATYFTGNAMKKWMNGKEVVAFEFISTEGAADALINSTTWQENNKTEKLQQNTRLDFLYIVCYVFFFIFLARNILNNNDIRLKTLTLIALVAGLCDAAENACLLQILDGQRGYYPAIMFGFALIKFALLVILAVALVATLFKKFFKNKTI